MIIGPMTHWETQSLTCRGFVRWDVAGQVWKRDERSVMLCVGMYVHM